MRRGRFAVRVLRAGPFFHLFSCSGRRSWRPEAALRACALPSGGRHHLSGACRAVRGDDLAVGQELTGVLEKENAVAQQAPSLFRVVRHQAGGLPVGGVSCRARWLVLAHWWDLSLCRGV